MKIITSIVSTTHVDRNNDQMTKNALESMAMQINRKHLPLLIEHDPKKIIGSVLYGEVFQLNDGEYALGTVSGIFDNKKEILSFKIGQPNIEWERCKKHLNANELKKSRENNQVKIQNMNNWRSNITTAELLEKHLDSTQIGANGTVYNIKRRVGTSGDLVIHVYPKDHRPHHFHVISKQRGINARFTLNPIELLNTKNGEIKKNDIIKIKDFFKNPIHKKKLMDEYFRLNKI